MRIEVPSKYKVVSPCHRAQRLVRAVPEIVNFCFRVARARCIGTQTHDRYPMVVPACFQKAAPYARCGAEGAAWSTDCNEHPIIGSQGFGGAHLPSMTLEGAGALPPCTLKGYRVDLVSPRLL